jgi:hypothetical protein
LKILKHMEGRDFKFLTFLYHLKFIKFNLDNILHKISSFWKFFKVIIQTREFRQKNLNSLKTLLYFKIFHHPNTLLRFWVRCIVSLCLLWSWNIDLLLLSVFSLLNSPLGSVGFQLSSHWLKHTSILTGQNVIYEQGC